MLKSNKLIFAIAFLSSFFAFQEINRDPVKDDLASYINSEMSKVAFLENRAVDEYNSILGAKIKDEAVIFKKLTNNVIPVYAQFLSEIKKIKPATKEVQIIHEQYIKAAEIQRDGLLLLASSIEKQNLSELVKANEQISTGKQQMEEILTDLNNLANSHGLAIKIPK
ncbi:hypothetical protein ACFU8X_28355 [Brevibacillus porteri]|uniref:hypothetical protein n=1 Tax=Brevibacillus porteri TaxID=2126350 RepID=UPI00370CC953